MVSIIRLPRMCSEFHKVMRKKGENAQKQTESRAIATLQSRMQGTDISIFMEDVLSKIEQGKRSAQPKRNTSTNAVAIKSMLKQIISQAQVEKARNGQSSVNGSNLFLSDCQSPASQMSFDLQDSHKKNYETF